MAALEALGTYPTARTAWSAIECPTLIVWGDRRPARPGARCRRFVELIGENSRRLVYADTGHVAMLERPARFNADVEAFLAEDAPEPAQ